VRYHREKQEFFKPGLDPHIAQLKYNRHCIRSMELLQQIVDLRRSIIRKSPKKHTAQPCPLKNLQTLLTGTMDSKEKPIVLSGKIVDPISCRSNSVGKVILGPSATIDQRKIHPADKTIMKDFIEKVWKEMLIFEKDENFSLRRTSSSLYKSREKLSPKRISPNNKRKSSAIPFKRVNIMNEDPYDIKKIIRKRREERQKTLQELEKKHQIENEKQEKANQEWKNSNEQMKQLENKLKSAEMRAENKNDTKLLFLLNTQRNFYKVQNNFSALRNEEKMRFEEKYIDKTRKIEGFKKTKNELLKNASVKCKEMIEQKMQKHMEISKKVEYEINSKLEQTKSLIENKLNRKKSVPTVLLVF